MLLGRLRPRDARRPSPPQRRRRWAARRSSSVDESSDLPYLGTVEEPPGAPHPHRLLHRPASSCRACDAMVGRRRRSTTTPSPKPTAIWSTSGLIVIGAGPRHVRVTKNVIVDDYGTESTAGRHGRRSACEEYRAAGPELTDDINRAHRRHSCRPWPERSGRECSGGEEELLRWLSIRKRRSETAPRPYRDAEPRLRTVPLSKRYNSPKTKHTDENAPIVFSAAFVFIAGFLLVGASRAAALRGSVSTIWTIIAWRWPWPCSRSSPCASPRTGSGWSS